MKHKVTFEMAKTVVYDDVAVQFFDEERSFGEQRFFFGHELKRKASLGVSSRDRGRGRYPVISARKVTISEAQNYRSE